MGWFWNSTKPPERSSGQGVKQAAEHDSCPADHTARQAWLDQAGQQRHQLELPSQHIRTKSNGCDSTRMKNLAPSYLQPATPFSAAAQLGTDRVISSIPRVSATTSSESSIPANGERESERDGSGKWIYPSERMFFEAMKRKNHDPRAEDMAAIVPIHNAVNERAWKEICDWESGRGSEKCGGPRLYSFSGSGTQKLTPRARLNTLLGYTAPFDRHDWVIDRCGQKIEYVIDFYSGRDEAKPGKSLNFYLDVRPKLNSWESWKMRTSRMLGFD